LTALHIRPVTLKSGFADFIRAAVVAQGRDPHWRRPLDHEIRQLFSPSANAYLRQNAVQAWVACRGGEPVGRIVAVHDLAYQAKYGRHTAFFGFLEGIDDPRVFAALIGTVREWAQARGLTRLEGPYSFSVNHEVGLLVDGFDEPPQTKMNHAQRWYGPALEDAGLRGIRDVLAHLHPLNRDDLGERYRKLAARWSDAPRLTLRSLESWGYETGSAIVNHIYNDAWSDNWGATPVGLHESRFIGSLMRPLVTGPLAGGDWVRVACWDGQPMAVVAQVPDINELTQGLDGSLFPAGWWHFLRRLKTGTRRTRLPMIGVRKAFRGTRPGAMAVSALLADATARARSRGVQEIEISWMLDDNADILRLVESMPARQYKRWRLYASDPADVPGADGGP
jgi:GNAT superfamily N-acetyltransferase